MNKKLIIRIANGFGNQMFNYAAGFTFAKKLGYELFIDDKSSFFSDKIKSANKNYLHWHPKYELNIFNISKKLIDDKFTFSSHLKKIYRKFLIFLNIFLFKKIFLVEKKNNFKKTKFENFYYDIKFSNKIYCEGYFESEKYFLEYRNDILNEFTFKSLPVVNREYLNQILNSNSVSIAVRRDRYSERIADQKDIGKLELSKKFEEETYHYIFNAINYFKKKIDNPKFFIFSDNFNNIEKIFDPSMFIFIKNNIKDKTLEDFFLMRNCKHFIVGPTSFHWWAAWLSDDKSIKTFPKNINPSNNADFWPTSWKAI